MHTGINGLIDVVYHQGNTTVMILDNRTTGMTGHQNNPTNGLDIYDNTAPEIDFEVLSKALGINDIQTVDPFDTDAMIDALKHATEFDGPSVIISKRPCVLLKKEYRKPSLVIDDSCIHCGKCMTIGCPAIVDVGDKMNIDSTLCVGCNLCASLCPIDAIGEVK